MRAAMPVSTVVRLASVPTFAWTLTSPPE